MSDELPASQVLYQWVEELTHDADAPGVSVDPSGTRRWFGLSFTRGGRRHSVEIAAIPIGGEPALVARSFEGSDEEVAEQTRAFRTKVKSWIRKQDGER